MEDPSHLKRHGISVMDVAFIKTLASREQFRDRYLQQRHPIAADRMLWRAQTFRHLVHLIPRQNILELSCGEGIFTRQLANTLRAEIPLQPWHSLARSG